MTSAPDPLARGPLALGPLALGPLVPGDRVALVAPAGPAPAELRHRAEDLLRSWELEPVAYPSASARHPRASYLAGEDAGRARDLEDAWCDPAVAGVFALRGGYGSLRVLDLLDAPRMRAARPKPFYGSSDLTAVHEWLREELGVASWFSPMVATSSLLDDAGATAALRVAVTEGLPGRRWSSPAAEVLVPGVATGPLVGGNLSLLARTLGAARRGPVDHRGAIVLLEDVGEAPYRIDGYLTSLLRAGWFAGVAGIALGSWVDCGPWPDVRALALELLGPLGVPLVGELGFGHGPAAHSLPLGQVCTLAAGSGQRPQLVVAPLKGGPVP